MVPQDKIPGARLCAKHQPRSDRKIADHHFQSHPQILPVDAVRGLCNILCVTDEKLKPAFSHPHGNGAWLKLLNKA